MWPGNGLEWQGNARPRYSLVPRESCVETHAVLLATNDLHLQLDFYL